LLQVLRLDYRGQETRVEFLCGKRALRDYQAKHRTALALATALTVGHGELEEAVLRLQNELKATRQELRAARERLLDEEAAQLVREAVPSGARRVVRGVWEGRSPADLRELASRLAAQPGVVALLASVAERTHLCVSCAEDAGIAATTLLRAVCALLDGKGGGQGRLAQGSAPALARERVASALHEVGCGVSYGRDCS
jgi:alanyl-tRNA synthetase